METAVRRIEHKYSRYRDDSILSRINNNAGQPTPIDAETHWLLNYAAVCYEQSDGLFDISSGVLRQAWDFRKNLIPSADALASLLPRIGFGAVKLSDHELLMPPDMELDLGGIGKEYAADVCADIARQGGVNSGIIDLGGNLHILGPRPQEDSHQSAGTASHVQPWQLGVRHPRKPQQAIARLPVYQGGMATSGDYERFFEKNGQRFCHLLNPHNGYPVDHWASVTVLAPSTLLAGTLSTIAMLRQQAAPDWLREQNLHALLIRPDLSTVTLTPDPAPQTTSE